MKRKIGEDNMNETCLRWTVRVFLFIIGISVLILWRNF